jgi:uncharacterized membrane protein
MSHPVDTRLVVGPNASMTVGQAWAVCGWVGSVALGIGIFFATRGFWPVLPFAGLEVGAFFAALWVSLRRNRYREVLSFEGNVVRIEFGLAGHGAQSGVELRRDWMRVAIENGPHRTSPTRLVLSSFGQRVEVARCLTDEERERLGARIVGLTGAAWRGADQHRGAVEDFNAS